MWTNVLQIAALLSKVSADQDCQQHVAAQHLQQQQVACCRVVPPTTCNNLQTQHCILLPVINPDSVQQQPLASRLARAPAFGNVSATTGSPRLWRDWVRLKCQNSHHFSRFPNFTFDSLLHALSLCPDMYPFTESVWAPAWAAGAAAGEIPTIPALAIPSLFCSWGLGDLYQENSSGTCLMWAALFHGLHTGCCSVFSIHQRIPICCLALLQAVEILPCPYSC